MRILALVPGGISEQILFFPTLATLKQRYPEAMIDVLVEPRAKAAYRVCPLVHEVLAFTFNDRNGPADYLNILGTIRDREYEMALSTGSSWVISLLLWLNGIPTRIGHQTSSSWFLSNPVSSQAGQYTAAAYHDLLKGLDIHDDWALPTINVPNSDIQWAEGEQKRLGLTDGYVLIYGGSASGLSYPMEKWQTILADIKSKQPNLPIVLLQDLEDSIWGAELVSLDTDLRISMPEDMGKAAAMIAGANLMIATESAALQLAVAVGTYTVALLGSNSAIQLLPPESEKVFALEASSDQLGDIEATEILSQIWQG